MLPWNPNKGASGRKTLALERGWRQGLRIETWVLQHIPPGDPRLLPQLRAHGLTSCIHYLVCPGRERLRMGTLTVDEPPPPSVRGRGRMARASRWGGICRQRALRLYMPLCWQEEADDARAAQAWLAEIARLREQGRVEPAGSPLEALLVERYGLLFAPRALLCADCLCLAYGSLVRSSLPAARRKWFARRGVAPELPDPLARDRWGRPFAHDQFRHPLPPSALKNAATRKAAGAVTWMDKAQEEAPARKEAARVQREREKMEKQKEKAAAQLRKRAAYWALEPLRGPRIVMAKRQKGRRPGGAGATGGVPVGPAGPKVPKSGDALVDMARSRAPRILAEWGRQHAQWEKTLLALGLPEEELRHPGKGPIERYLALLDAADAAGMAIAKREMREKEARGKPAADHAGVGGRNEEPSPVAAGRPRHPLPPKGEG